MQVFKKLWLIVLCCCFLSVGTQGQQLSADDLLLNAEELINSIDLDGQSNSAFINQIGDKNSIEIEQDLIGNIANYANVLQIGSDNFTLIKQVGESNKSFVIQEGNGNEYLLSVEGFNNTFLIRQIGDNNLIDQEMTNASNLLMELIQEGNDNTIIYKRDGMTNQSLTIRQIGDGLKIEVIQSNQ